MAPMKGKDPKNLIYKEEKAAIPTSVRSSPLLSRIGSSYFPAQN